MSEKVYLLIDNYDSFTFNLIQCLADKAKYFEVWRNDEFDLSRLNAFDPQMVMISPGPGRPETSGLTPEVVSWAVAHERPLLGICLGCQAIGQHFGAVLDKAQKVMHGKSSLMIHDGQSLFEGLESPLEVGRYHSLALKSDTMPECLQVTATAQDDAEIMAVKHKTLPIEGLQFHPESILSPHGKQILGKFFEVYEGFMR